MSLDFKLAFPPCSHCGAPVQTVFDYNITHNLVPMAKEAGIYTYLWHPETIPNATAADFIPALERGLQDLRARPDHFRRFNPENGWGTYDGLVNFVERTIEACRAYPRSQPSAET